MSSLLRKLGSSHTSPTGLSSRGSTARESPSPITATSWLTPLPAGESDSPRSSPPTAPAANEGQQFYYRSVCKKKIFEDCPQLWGPTKRKFMPPRLNNHCTFPAQDTCDMSLGKPSRNTQTLFNLLLKFWFKVPLSSIPSRSSRAAFHS